MGNEMFWLRWLLRLVLFPVCAVLANGYFWMWILSKTAVQAVKLAGQRR